MKVGVVGYGSIGKRHATNIVALGHDVLVYDPLVRRDVAFERNIYEICDAVVIATPSELHPAGLRAAAERGKHMLIEKPIATSGPDVVADLLAVAKRNGAVVMMGNNLRFHPCVIAAKNWIDQGHIGAPRWAKFICASEVSKKTYRDDGVILNSGAHEVDLALHLLGPAKALCASAHCTEHGDDIADFVLEHKSGARSSFHLDYVTKREIRELRLVGEGFDIYCDLLKRYASLSDAEEPNNFQWKYDVGSYDDDYIDEMRAFIDRCEDKEVRGATGEDGLAALHVLLDARKMAGLG